MLTEHTATYCDDLIIRDKSNLAALCVFYDRVQLPFIAPGVTGMLLRVLGEDPHLTDCIQIESAAEFVNNWDSRHASLYQHQVLQRLGPPVQPELHLTGCDIAVLMDRLRPNITIAAGVEPQKVRAYLVSRVIHHFRKDHHSPLLYSDLPDTSPREVYKSLLASEAFGCLIPALGELEPDQILEVRRQVSDTREGFSMHLQRLSRDVEDQCRSGERGEEIRRFARSVVETQLIPDYREFRRQLIAEKSQSWGRVLDIAGKALRLSFLSTIPQFVENVFTLGTTLSGSLSDHQREKCTNANLAFRFLSRVDAEVGQIVNA